MLPIFALLAVSVFVVREQSQAENNPKEKNQMLKAVVHVTFSDPERQGNGLKNVDNILKEVGNDAEIEVVAHGAGIVLWVQGESKHADKLQSLIEHKVKFVACKNTLRDKSIAEDRLLPGVQVIASGAVEGLRKQQNGFSYFKP
jgi:intracellular sulfur oxidation DsrE/DsrF family protein